MCLSFLRKCYLKVKKSLCNIAQNLGRILKLVLSLQVHPLGRILKPRHLCLAIVRPFRNLFLHRNKVWSYISFVFVAQCAIWVSVCSMPKQVLLLFFIICANRNFSNCVICAFVICFVSQTLMESLECIPSLVTT